MNDKRKNFQQIEHAMGSLRTMEKDHLSWRLKTSTRLGLNWGLGFLGGTGVAGNGA